LISNRAATASSCRTCPKVKDRNVPSVEGARAPVTNRPIAPCRSNAMSSKLSAPATIPAARTPTSCASGPTPRPRTFASGCKELRERADERAQEHRERIAELRARIAELTAAATVA